MGKLKIKNCPFCGDEAEIIEREDSYSLNIAYDVKCLGQACYLSDGADWHFETEQEAMEKWNARS